MVILFTVSVSMFLTAVLLRGILCFEKVLSVFVTFVLYLILAIVSVFFLIDILYTLLSN